MARIYTIEEIKPERTEDNQDHVIFRMRFHSQSIPNYSDLIDWVNRQPKNTGFQTKNFDCSITAHYESYVILRSRAADGVPTLKYFDVRVYREKDANYFRKCWQIEPDVYTKNLASVRDIEARASGWIRIGDRQYGISDLIPRKGAVPLDQTPQSTIREGVKLAREFTKKGSVTFKIKKKR